MMRTATEDTVEVSKQLPARPEAAYKTWTDPAAVRQWFAPGMMLTRCEIDARAGGRYTIVVRFSCEKSCEIAGEFREVVPNRRLVYSWTTEGAAEDVIGTVVRVEFEPTGGAKGGGDGTMVKVTHEGLESESSRREHRDGWMQNLESMERVLGMERLERQIEADKKRLAALRTALPRMCVPEYELQDVEGRKVKLSSLFGKGDELIVIHNMGLKCPYCTLWADGFNGVHRHLENRCGFVVVSPDEPGMMREFAKKRGWGFRMLSGHGTSFIADMGFEPKAGDVWPGVSTFRREANGTIHRVASAHFGPGDDFCSVWHLFALLDKGANEWGPRYSY